nr:oligosaccharide flippase family protein [Acidimicrobiia bacterium]
SQDEVARLARDSGLNLVGMLVTQVANMGVVLALARVIGRDAVGVYSQAFALRAMLMLVAALGMRTSMTHFVARYRADGDAGAARGAVRLGLVSTASVSVALAAVLAATAPWLSADVFDDPELVTPIRLAAVSLPFFVAMTVALAATQGFKTMRAFAGVGLIAEPGLRLLFTLAVVAVGLGVVASMWVLVAASVACALLAVRAIARYLARMRPARPVYHLGEVLRFSGYSWVASIATQGLLWADIVILGTFVSSADVGVYQVATRVVLLGTMVTPALTASLSPRVADSWRRGDSEGLRDSYRALTGWTMRLSLPILAAIVVFPGQVLRLFGGGFEDGTSVIGWLVFGAAVETLSAPSAIVLNQANHNRVNMVINVAALVLNVALNLALIPAYGIEGSAIAWTLALILPGIARIVAVHHLVTRMWPWDRAQLKAVVAVIVAGLVAFGFGQVVPGPWWSRLILGSLLLLAVYLAGIMVSGPAAEDAAALRSVSAVVTRMLFSRRRQVEKARLRRSLDGLERPDEPLPLWPVVSPFRYDIVVRSQFFDVIAEQEPLWRRDVDAFVDLAQSTPYHTWFNSVAVHSIGVENDRAEREKAFDRRVRKSLALWDEFTAAGRRFDTRYPVTVRPIEGDVVGRIKRVRGRRFQPVDGCHRLALLLRSGRQQLEPGEYRIAAADAPLLDNTERLTADLGLDPATYYRFVSKGFLDVEHGTRDALLAAVAAGDPGLAADLDAVMAVDETAMSRESVEPDGAR